VLTRVHSECLTGDVFGSCRCDCGAQLTEAMERIAIEGRGVVIYLRGHEGRGIGLAAKLQAYRLQDAGRDTVDANVELGLPVDSRHYGAAAQILRDLGVSSVRLLTNNPEKVASLAAMGIAVAARIPLTPLPNHHNEDYLRTKRERMGTRSPSCVVVSLPGFDRAPKPRCGEGISPHWDSNPEAEQAVAGTSAEWAGQ
jgi:3,4-dihydroxy 2-butanone 4-phosphate synthase / GTP cyclohydrolase II